MMSAVDVIAGLYDAFGRGDIPAVLGAMDQEIHWYEAENNPYRPDGEPCVGPEAVLNDLFMKLPEDWDDFAVRPHTFHAAGNVVVVEARYGGTHRATGRPLDTQVCHIWTLQDGKVTKFQQYLDTVGFQAAMGIRD